MRRVVILAAVLATLAVGCGRGQSPSIGGGQASGPPQTDLVVTAKDIAFTPTSFTAPVGKELSITFKNEDSIGHSFHLSGGTAGDLNSGVKTGPSSDVLHVTLRTAASYPFQCDVHPAKMKGTIVVVKADS